MVYTKPEDREGRNFDDFFIGGAREVLRIAEMARAEAAIFKERSPSCGSTLIYDGSFRHRLKPGRGVTVALLREHGIKVYSEQDFS